jgi:hypothetical protein
VRGLVAKHATEPFMVNFAALAPALAGSLGVEVFEPCSCATRGARAHGAAPGRTERLRDVAGETNEAIEDGPARSGEAVRDVRPEVRALAARQAARREQERDAASRSRHRARFFAGDDVDGKPLAIARFPRQDRRDRLWGFW